MTIEKIREHWNGPFWRWWALAAGGAIVGLTALMALLLSLIVGQSMAALLAIALLAELLILSMIGSGTLTATSRRMSRGGLARETATLDLDYKSQEQSEAEKERDRKARDRRTIRIATMILPLILTLMYLLAR